MAGVGWRSSGGRVVVVVVPPTGTGTGAGFGASLRTGTASDGPPPGVRPKASSVHPTTLSSPSVRLSAATGPVTSMETVLRVPSGDSWADRCRLGASRTNHRAKQTTPMNSTLVHGTPGKGSRSQNEWSLRPWSAVFRPAGGAASVGASWSGSDQS